MKKEKELFINSIKNLDRKFAYTFLLDLVSYIVIFLILSTFISTFTKSMTSLPQAPILDPEINSAEDLQQVIAQMTSSINSVKSNLFLSVILILISWNFFKASIYSVLLKKKFNAKIFGKYLLMKIIWLIIWLIPVFILFLLLKPNIFYFLLAIIFIFYWHFTFLLNIEFFNDYKSKIKKVLKKNFRYCPRFIIPETLVFLVFIITSQLYWIYKFLPNPSIIAGLIFLLFVTWTRIYLIKVFHS